MKINEKGQLEENVDKAMKLIEETFVLNEVSMSAGVLACLSIFISYASEEKFNKKKTLEIISMAYDDFNK